MTGRLLAIAWKTKPRAPMQTADSAIVGSDAGLVGDFRAAAPDRHVTIVFADDWAAACRACGAEPPWTTRRANLLVSGLSNPKRAGGIIRIGEVALAITGETAPCSRMEEQQAGLRAALTPDWRGGLTTRVISGGPIRVGDEVSIEA